MTGHSVFGRLSCRLSLFARSLSSTPLGVSFEFHDAARTCANRKDVGDFRDRQGRSLIVRRARFSSRVNGAHCFVLRAFSRE